MILLSETYLSVEYCINDFEIESLTVFFFCGILEVLIGCKKNYPKVALMKRGMWANYVMSRRKTFLGMNRERTSCLDEVRWGGISAMSTFCFL